MQRGCHAGHGLGGIPRFSLRSFVCTCIFFGTSMIVATMRYHIGFLDQATAVDDVYPLQDNLVVVGLCAAGFCLLCMIAMLVFSKGANKTDISLSFGFGACFASSLAISGILSRDRIVSFLTIGCGWTPYLLILFATCLVGNTVAFRFILGTPLGNQLA
mmetsp:Transcript_11892/g.25468  ORF Transcript_11892/g.25468 Transcript_11892/m.25468 type:complete len:159 (+) Transcript_11892:351-827(+)